ncbi:MAG: DUF389 domain-containing protein [Spirochaetota bacterium]
MATRKRSKSKKKVQADTSTPAPQETVAAQETPKELAENEEEKGEFFKKVEETGGRVHSFLAKLPQALKVTRNDTLEMHQEIDEGARVRSIAYWLFIITAVGIASLGLILNSPAVIIGAMLVSPLMAPIISFGMSIAIGDFYMGLRAIIILSLSILVSILTSAGLTLLIPITEPTSEIIARTNPTLLDLFIALLSGLVAALSSVRSKGEEILSKAGPGAAIGVALMPPLCVVGYGLGIGFDWNIMWGAFLLFITNMFAIVMVSSLFYYFLYTDYNINSIIKRLTTKRENSDFMFKWFKGSPFWKSTHGSLSSAKRFLFPALLLALISYPLYSSFLFLKQKYEVRKEVNLYIDQIQGVDIIRGTDKLLYDRENVSGTIIFSSKQIPPQNFYKDLNKKIQSKFPNYKANITLVRVAGESDISELKDVARKTQELTQKNKELFLETVPSLMQNSIRERHAGEIVQEILQVIYKNFPKSIGLILHTTVSYDVQGLREIQAYYIGEELQEEKKALVEKSLTKEVTSLFRRAKDIKLFYAGKYKNQIECGRKKSAKRVEEEIQKLTRIANQNPNIKIAIQAQEKIEYLFKLEFSRLPKNIEVLPVTSKRKCLLEYEYSKNK